MTDDHEFTVRAVRNADRPAVEVVCSCGDYCDWDGTKQRLTGHEVNDLLLLHTSGYVRAVSEAALHEWLMQGAFITDPTERPAP